MSPSEGIPNPKSPVTEYKLSLSLVHFCEWLRRQERWHRARDLTLEMLYQDLANYLESRQSENADETTVSFQSYIIESTKVFNSQGNQIAVRALDNVLFSLRKEIRRSCPELNLNVGGTTDPHAEPTGNELLARAPEPACHTRQVPSKDLARKGGTRLKWNPALQAVINDIAQQLNDDGIDITAGYFRDYLNEGSATSSAGGRSKRDSETGLETEEPDCDELFLNTTMTPNRLHWTNREGVGKNLSMKSLDPYFKRAKSSIKKRTS